MGRECSKKNIIAITRADNQVTGDIFSEAERLKNFDSEQLASYELHMARLLGNDYKAEKPSALDVLKKRRANQKAAEKVKNFDRLYARPSEIFSEKFFGAIEKRGKEWAKKGGDYKTYKELIGKPAGEVLKAIDGIVVAGKPDRMINTELKKFGISLDNVYEARGYLEWLNRGGPTQRPDESFAWLIDRSKDIAKAQSNLNLLWSAGNVTDMIRVFSHYATKQGGGLKAILEGTAKALEASGGNPFKKVKELEKKGVYQTQYVDREGKNLNPFEWTITAQKNLVYHIDKASGGDGITGIRDTLFDSSPLDRPAFDRNPTASPLVYGLVRYPINETRWLFNTAASALKGDARSATNLALFFAARTYFTGLSSNVPAPFFAAMSKDDKEAFKAWEEKFGFFGTPSNIIKLASGGRFDLSGYTQLMGGTLGARANSVADSAMRVFKDLGRSSISLGKGNIPAAGANALAAIFALNNFGLGFGKIKINDEVNSTTLTKMLETTGEFLGNEFGLDKLTGEYLKDAFGNAYKKEPKEEGGTVTRLRVPGPKKF